MANYISATLLSLAGGMGVLALLEARHTADRWGRMFGIIWGCTLVTLVVVVLVCLWG